VSLAVTVATALRVAGQLRRDRRTLGLVLVVPPALLALLDATFAADPTVMDHIGPALVGLLPLVMMFLITSIAMLRERTTGTLERLMSMPLAKIDLLAGYALAFALVAAVQATVTGTVAFVVLGIHTAGPPWAVVGLAVGNAVLGMALGLLVSAFATTEFQAVQFLPAFVLPQLLLIGLFVPRDRLPAALRAVAAVLPATYAYDALVRVAADAGGTGLALDLAAVGASIALALGLAAATLRRRTP
jgi:ABC-2 type transport system permease protein